MHGRHFLLRLFQLRHIQHTFSNGSAAAGAAVEKIAPGKQTAALGLGRVSERAARSITRVGGRDGRHRDARLLKTPCLALPCLALPCLMLS